MSSWEKIAEEFTALSKRQEGEIDVYDFMAMGHTDSYNAAAKYLQRMCVEGKATRRAAILNGKRGWLYRLK